MSFGVIPFDLTFPNVKGSPIDADILFGYDTEGNVNAAFTLSGIKSYVGSPAWASISGKPISFPPSAHTLGSHSNVNASIDSATYGQLIRMGSSGFEAFTHNFALVSQIPNVPSWVLNITETEKANWNTAYGWGDWENGVDKAFVDLLGIDASTLNGFDFSDFATAAQGLLAEYALQPGDNISELVNDSGYITGFTESDPVFSASPAAGISIGNIGTWNSKAIEFAEVTDNSLILIQDGIPKESGAIAIFSENPYDPEDEEYDTWEPELVKFQFPVPVKGAPAIEEDEFLTKGQIPDPSPKGDRVVVRGTLTLPTATTLSGEDWSTVVGENEYNEFDIAIDPIQDKPANWNRRDIVIQNSAGVVTYIPGDELEEGIVQPATPAGQLLLAFIDRTPAGDNTVYLTEEDASDFVSKSATGNQTIQSDLTLSVLTGGNLDYLRTDPNGKLQLVRGDKVGLRVTEQGTVGWARVIRINTNIPTQLNYGMTIELSAVESNDYQTAKLSFYIRFNSSSVIQDSSCLLFGKSTPARYKIVKISTSVYELWLEHATTLTMYIWRPLMSFGSVDKYTFYHREPITALPAGDQLDFEDSNAEILSDIAALETWLLDLEGEVDDHEDRITDLETRPYIEDIHEGSNISIDKTDPKNPIISATGGGGSIDQDNKIRVIEISKLDLPLDFDEEDIAAKITADGLTISDKEIIAVEVINPPAVFPTTGLVAVYEFDEETGTTAIDAYTNSLDGSISGATINQPGLINKCYSFDGSNDWVNLGNDPLFQISAGTIALRLKTSNPGSGFRAVMVKHGAYGIYFSGGVLGFYDFTANSFRSSGLNISDGMWHHIMLAFDGSINEGKLYLDNVLVATAAMTISNQGNELAVGSIKIGGTISAYVNAQIDQPSIWSGILSTAGRNNWYNQGNGVAL